MSREQTKISFLRSLNESLRLNPAWQTLFEAVESVLDDTINEQTTQLSRIRQTRHIRRGDYLETHHGRAKVGHIQRFYDNNEPYDLITASVGTDVITIQTRALHDRRVLIDSAKNLGFDYFSDTLSDDDYERIVEYASAYWPESAKPDFIKFIGFIKNLDLTMENLWTRDKGDHANSDDPILSQYSFLEPLSPQLRPVYRGGQDYQTSHVEVTYDALFSPQFELEDFTNLFYFLAPINLVLERIIADLRVEQDYSVIMGSTLTTTESSRLVIADLLNQTLRITRFEVGTLPEATRNSVLEAGGVQPATTPLLSAFTSKHTGYQIRYQELADDTIGLKCYVNASIPEFFYNSLVLYTEINGVEKPYSVHAFKHAFDANPKFSTEYGSTGSSLFVWLELTLHNKADRDKVLLSNLPRDTPTIAAVANFQDLDVPLQEKYDHYHVHKHYNMPNNLGPHVVFMSENHWYGRPLQTPASAGTIPQDTNFYRTNTGVVPAGMEIWEEQEPNSSDNTVLYARKG